MAVTYQDAIAALEICGVWVSSERTELASIYTEMGGSYTESQWMMIRQNINNAAALISGISVPEYGKEPAALTDEEIMEIRNEISEELWLQIFDTATDISSSLQQIIEAVWNVTENQYSFAIVPTDVATDTFVTYVGRAGMPKIFPSRVSAYYPEVGVAVVLKDSEIPEVSAGGVLYGWYSSNDTSGAMLKAGDILPLSNSGSRFIGTVYAGIAKKEVSVQMRTKQMINGAIQEFLVYPKTQGGGGGDGESNMIMWDEQSETEIGNVIMEKLVAGVSPVIWHVGTGMVFYPMNLTENAFLFASWEVDPPTGFTSNWFNLTKDGDEWRLMAVTATWSATFQEA